MIKTQPDVYEHAYTQTI